MKQIPQNNKVGKLHNQLFCLNNAEAATPLIQFYEEQIKACGHLRDREKCESKIAQIQKKVDELQAKN